MKTLFGARRKSKSSIGSNIALAIALASGTVLAAGGVAEPAFAKKSKAKISKEFSDLYNPIVQEVQAGGEQAAAQKGAIPAVIAAAQSPDEMMRAGQLAVNVGIAAKDDAMQREGVDMMLRSGITPIENVPTLLLASGQLAFKLGDYPAARQQLQEAVKAGNNSVDIRPLIAESYFKEGNTTEGLNYLSAQISALQAAGKPVPKNWIARGFAMAFEADDPVNSRRFAQVLVAEHPSASSWGDAIAVERTFYDYDDNTTLDLMRLARKTNSLRIERDYVDYINAADARRFPGEVSEVIAAGLASGLINTSDPYIKDAQQQSSSRVSADKSELASLESEARAASANLRTVMAAADALLSYGKYDGAADLYTSALTKAGVPKDRALLRLGIAQIGQGKFSDAEATLGQVHGAGEAVATLWSLYAKQQAGS